MADVMSPEARSYLMSRVRSKNTRPELKVRKLLHGLGYRYRLHKKGLPGTPDIVLARFDTVVFVNGCFWHGHSCPKGRLPETNHDEWKEKIDTNMRRDQRNYRALRADGWNVLVVWECETRDPERLVKRLLDAMPREEAS